MFNLNSRRRTNLKSGFFRKTIHLTLSSRRTLLACSLKLLVLFQRFNVFFISEPSKCLTLGHTNWGNQTLALSYVSCLQCRVLHKNKRGVMLGQIALYLCFSPLQEKQDSSFHSWLFELCPFYLLCVLLSGTMGFQLLCCCSSGTKI